MAVGRAERRNKRKSKITAIFGEDRASVVLDLLVLVELAWHDVYDEVTPPEDVIDDMLLLSEGSIEKLVVAAHLGLADWRDLRVVAEERRGTN